MGIYVRTRDGAPILALLEAGADWYLATYLPNLGTIGEAVSDL